jgi:hypothetical protein
MLSWWEEVEGVVFMGAAVIHQQFGNLDSGFSWFPLVSGLPETWKLGDSAHIELKCENY